MRHKVGQRKLHRTTSHRLAMLNNMVTSLLEHQAIRTTVPKAKEARKIAERIITLGKKGGLSNVRLAARTVKDRDVLQKVFSEYKDRYATRPGGYTRLIRLGFRRGDAAEMALLELVDRPATKAAPVETEGGEAATEETKAE
jgi:large subunit ribosomal protein L17